MMRRLSTGCILGQGLVSPGCPLARGSGGLARKLVLRAVWEATIEVQQAPKEDLSLKKSPMSRP